MVVSEGRGHLLIGRCCLISVGKAALGLWQDVVSKS